MAHDSSALQFDWDAPGIAQLIRAALAEDIGPCDATVEALIPETVAASAKIIAKQNLVVAGLPPAERVFRALSATVEFNAKCAEGQSVAQGTTIAEINGSARAILTGERTTINFLAHLCGVATLAHQFADAIRGTNARIRDTRKTTPLLRALEKYAVRAGGATNHRFGLYDAILIKENHVAAAGGITEALRRAKSWTEQRPQRLTPRDERADRAMTAYESFAPPSRANEAGIEPVSIQIEVRNEAELREALAAGADSVLLDNLSPAECARLVKITRALRPTCTIEASGNIRLDTARVYAETGVDFLSAGAITHSAPAADLSLLVELAQRR